MTTSMSTKSESTKSMSYSMTSSISTSVSASKSSKVMSESIESVSSKVSNATSMVSMMTTTLSTLSSFSPLPSPADDLRRPRLGIRCHGRKGHPEGHPGRCASARGRGQGRGMGGKDLGGVQDGLRRKARLPPHGLARRQVARGKHPHSPGWMLPDGDAVCAEAFFAQQGCEVRQGAGAAAAAAAADAYTAVLGLALPARRGWHWCHWSP